MNLGFDFSKIEGFDWDNGNLEHIKKHNVSKEECEGAFLNKVPIVTEDESHSQLEQRYRIYGQTEKDRLLFLIVTLRENKVRVISARDQNRKERREFKLIGGEKR